MAVEQLAHVTTETWRLYLTCVVLIKEANFLPHQDSVEVISEPEV